MRRSRKLLLGCILTVIFVAISQAQDTTAGQQIFNSTCAACHGLDGEGGEHAPNIASEARVQRMTDAAITSIVHKGIPASGMPAFAGSLDDAQISSVVKYLRTLQASKAPSSSMGDATRGRALFFGEAKCADCHMVDGKGGFLGADLSGYGATHAPAAIRASIGGSNLNRDARHGTATVTMRNGQTYEGVLRNEDNFSVQIQTPDGAFHLLDKSGVARIEHDPQSLRHANYASKLTAQQLDDLVAFLSKSNGARVSENDNDEEH